MAIHRIWDYVVRTDYILPPIPDRQFDWSAVDDETYDGEGCAIGYGRTEQAAIDDLLDQLTEGEYSAANGQFGVGA